MRRLEILLVVFCLALQCWAVPAPDDTFIVRQPDGAELEVRWLGDESFHVMATADGKIILEDVLGYYSYVNEKGEPSGVYARNPAGRSARDLMFLLTLDQEAIFENLWKEAPRVAALDYRIPDFVFKDLQRMPSPNTKITTGETKGLVVLVQFKDLSFKSPDPQAQFRDYMNKEGYNEYFNRGSVRDYFVQNSNGLFKPYFDVYGPVTISKNRDDYGSGSPTSNPSGYTIGARDALYEALDTLIKNGIDLSPYDNDKNGKVDFVFMFFAGPGQNNTTVTTAIWPHAWYLYKSQPELYNVRYACANELDGPAYTKDNNTSILGGIGTFVHEFSHVLGLPDLYDLKNGNPYKTPKRWDVMDQGNYNCPSNEYGTSNCAPPFYSTFEKMSLGWMHPTELYINGEARLDKVNDHAAFSITNPENPDEMFLLEYRTKKDWDVGHPKSGMLIWHIDYKKSVWDAKTINNDGSHMHVDIEEAVPDPSGSYAKSSDVFPGSGSVTSFSDFTLWNGTTIDVKLSNIRESDDHTYATFTVEMEVLSSSSEVASSSSEEQSSSSEEAVYSSAEESSSSDFDRVSSGSSDSGTEFVGRAFFAGNVLVLRQENSVLVQLSRHGKNTVRLFGLNGNEVYGKSFEGTSILVPLSTKMEKQAFVLTVEQDGVLLTTRQIR